MPAPTSTDASIRSLTAYPRGVRLSPGRFQQVIVQAAYSDGRTDDVTRWAKFASTDETVARVDEFGRVTVVGPGRGRDHRGVRHRGEPAHRDLALTRRNRPKSSPRAPRTIPSTRRTWPSSSRWESAPRPMRAMPLSSAGRRSMRPARCPRRRGRGIPQGPNPSKRAELVDRLLAEPGVRRLLGVQVVGPVPRLDEQAPAPGHVVVLPVPPQERGTEPAVGQVRPAI